MPLPNPNKGEQKQDFVSRFMRDDATQKEFPKQEQRLAVAYSQWRAEHGGEQQMSLAINHAVVQKVAKAIDEGKIDHGDWSAPVGSDRKEYDCLAVDLSAPPAERCEYPVFVGDKVSAKGLGSAAGYAETNLPELHKLLAPLLEKIHAKTPKKMSLVVDVNDTGKFCMSLVGAEMEVAEPSDLVDWDGSPLPGEILGLPCTYAWKDASSIGDWPNVSKGFDFPVSQDRIGRWLSTNERMNRDKVRVPILDDHDRKAGDANGRIVRMRQKGDRIQVLMQLVGPEAVRKAASNDVSVGIDPVLNVAGKVYMDAIEHVALTPFPANPGLNNAVLAASRAAAGSPATQPPAAQPIERSHTMAATLTDGHVGALRKMEHLGMSNVPDEKIGDHLVDREQREADNLHQMCMAMPGGSECPPGEQMSRAVQHVKTMSHVMGKLLPKNMSLAAVKPDELQGILDQRVETLSKAGEQIDGLTATIDRQNKQIQEMSRAMPTDPFTDANVEATAIENMSLAFDQLSTTKDGVPPFIVDRLKKVLVTGDGKKARTMCMSQAANTGASKSLASELLGIFRDWLEVGPMPKVGERSRMQTMSRAIPGQVGPTEEQNKIGGNRLKKAMGVKVPA